MIDGQTRKANSEAILAREGVPFIAHLPLIGSVAENRFRSAEEVAERALSLAFVSLMGESGDHALVNRLVDEWNVRAQLTPKEKDFIASQAPSDHDRAQFSWRYEALWPLVWSLGFFENLGRPDSIVNVSELVGTIVRLGPSEFRKNAKLRDPEQILDALDLTYRYHWAIVDAHIKNADAPAGLDGGIVMERHHALNWLTCYADQEWDDVSTDT